MMNNGSIFRETEAIFESYRGRPFRQYQTRTNKSITTNQSAINKKGKFDLNMISKYLSIIIIFKSIGFIISESCRSWWNYVRHFIFLTRKS